MPEKILCHLCGQRPARRACPKLEREICAQCCGEEREQSIGCPLDCPYLREAREHEKLPPFDARTLPHREIELTARFMEQNQELAIVLGRLLLMASMETPGAVDADVREALESLVTSAKTAESGLIYEAAPGNVIAGGVVSRFREELTKFREEMAKRAPERPVSDKALLGVLIFWQRTEYQRSNGRRKGRSFIESLFGLLPPPADPNAQPSA